MKKRLKKSIEYLKGYCDKHDDCKKCKLYNDETGCQLRNRAPMDWDYKAEMEET